MRFFSWVVLNTVMHISIFGPCLRTCWKLSERSEKVKRDQKWLKYQIKDRQNCWSTYHVDERQFKSLPKIVFFLSLFSWSFSVVKPRRRSILRKTLFYMYYTYRNAWTGSCCSGKLVLYYLFNCYIIPSRHFSPVSAAQALNSVENTIQSIVVVLQSPFFCCCCCCCS